MLNYYYANYIYVNTQLLRIHKIFYLCTLNNRWNMSSFFFYLMTLFIQHLMTF